MDNTSTSNEAGLDDGPPKFTLFPELPFELREKIWEESCKDPRVLDLWALPVGTAIGTFQEFVELFQCPPFAIRTHQSDPGVLKACQESRKVANRHFKLSFGTRFAGDEKDFPSFSSGPGAEIIIKTPPLIYVNWEVDIICPFPTNSDSRWKDFDPEGAVIANLIGYHSYYGPRARVRRTAVEATQIEGIATTLFQTHCLEEIILYSVPYRLRYILYDQERPIAIEFESLDGDIDAKLRESGCDPDAQRMLEHAKFEFEAIAKDMKEKHPDWECPAINFMIMKATEIRGRA